MDNNKPKKFPPFFLLIGGFGKRLRPVVSDVPKPMAPILGKPFLWYKLMQLKSVGFREFVFCTGYLGKIIEDYFGDGSKFGVSIKYAWEKEALGTAGAIKNAEKYFNQPSFIGNGDTYLDFDPIPMLEFIKKKDSSYYMLLTDPHVQGQEGLVSTDDNWRILSFREKVDANKNERKINAGIYYMSPAVLDYIPSNQKYSLELDVFPRLLSDGIPIYGYNYDGYFIDIGLPDKYYEFCKDVERKGLRSNFENL